MAKRKKKTPTYDLAVMQAMVLAEQYRITGKATKGAFSLNLDEDDICECVLALDSRNFYKTMPSKKKAGTFQDVYKRHHYSIPIYLKLQMLDDKTVIISFTRDESI